ncbi:glycoside hydrolase family 27 protein [uncultured Acetobacteroides sp.]|uniref:glycoside hydrolase family 27 protein n=1 Tax=uncultured Acetobacteroides sp. TaxID=1760811 RepID=UPI0029F5690A|nr:glycoside hydrolase family 27 protein [uncultured Acetobacteroides sp.]
MKKIVLMLALAIAVGSGYAQKFANLAKTPPMGWNSWNKFACNIDEKLIREIADAMVANGYKAAGYEYIVIDDCWHGQRDSLGFIHPDPTRFPSGIKALADYVHSKGLKFGIYSDAGTQTCGGKPGSLGHEYQDAITYAQWGVDYLKYDWCFTENVNSKGAYTTMSKALAAAGHPILFSMCEWGTNKPWLWASNIAHMWRTTGDIFNCFDGIQDHGTYKCWGTMQILDMSEPLRQYAAPGHWNDLDMLEVGNGMPANEDRAHFTMWCMVASPLIMGHDLRNASAQTQEILTNKEVIAVSQDSLGIAAFKHSTKDSIQVWCKPLKGGDWAICFLNRGKNAANVEFDWKTQAVVDTLSNTSASLDKVIYQLKDLWAKKPAGTTKSKLKAVVPGHDVVLLRLTPIKKK